MSNEPLEQPHLRGKLPVLFLILSMLACNLPLEDAPTSTPPTTQAPTTVTAEPTISATQELPFTKGLALDTIWLAIDGPSTHLLILNPERGVELIDLPLNDGQTASVVAATPDGSLISYLVSDADGSQRGIALWRPDEGNARLVVSPLPGYRIIDVLVDDDRGGIITMQVQNGLPLEEADWQAEILIRSGEQPILLTNREAMGDLAPDTRYPPEIIGVLDDGSILLNFRNPDGSGDGLFSVNIDSGNIVSLISESDQIRDPQVSPDRKRIAYLSYDGSVPGAPGDLAVVNVLKVLDVGSGETLTMAPPEDHAIFGMRWHSDNIHLLLDVVAFPPDELGRVTQLWTVVEVGQPLPWPGTTLGPEINNLFDYELYKEGVIFTHLPDGGNWELYLISPLTGDGGGLQTFSLLDLMQDEGIPIIIYTPAP